MAYVVQRTTKAGSLSTALVESYRDEQGRPRQRLLANLHGEPTPLQALAKLTVQWGHLHSKRESLPAELGQDEPGHRGAGFVMVPERALTEHNHRMAQIDRQLAIIKRDAAGIYEHCTVSDDELQAAIQTHEQNFKDTFHEVLGREWAYNQQLKEAKARLRRLLT